VARDPRPRPGDGDGGGGGGGGGDDGDPITIAGTARDGALVLSVRDQGPGIAPEDLATLFDRTGRAVRRRVSGTGLGLPIVAAVARAHGGTASVTSELGVGTTVAITVPGLRITRRDRPATDSTGSVDRDRSAVDEPTTDGSDLRGRPGRAGRLVAGGPEDRR
jgi:hypothetical protein